jgi:hypothetical protein
MKITDKARNYLQQALKKQAVSGIRLYFAGIS